MRDKSKYTWLRRNKTELINATVNICSVSYYNLISSKKKEKKESRLLLTRYCQSVNVFIIIFLFWNKNMNWKGIYYDIMTSVCGWKWFFTNWSEIVEIFFSSFCSVPVSFFFFFVFIQIFLLDSHYFANWKRYVCIKKENIVACFDVVKSNC